MKLNQNVYQSITMRTRIRILICIWKIKMHVKYITIPYDTGI